MPRSPLRFKRYYAYPQGRGGQVVPCLFRSSAERRAKVYATHGHPWIVVRLPFRRNDTRLGQSFRWSDTGGIGDLADVRREPREQRYFKPASLPSPNPAIEPRDK